MRRHRHLLAVALLTTALCADRAALAAPVERPAAVEVAGRFIQRLEVSLRRTMPPLRLYQPRTPNSKPAPAPVVFAQVISKAPSIQLSPFDFRLPPPLI
jgi:hypothetical protein